MLTGGQPVDGAGYFFAPTVLTDVPATARLVREEIFGPVAPISTFATDDEAIARANDTEYGLVAYAFTQDLSRALTVGEGAGDRHGRDQPGHRVQPGRAVRRGQASGLGREGGSEGIEEYLETKYVGIAP